MADERTADVELRRLFEACDKHRRGFVGRDEFAELCDSLQIGRNESEVIFADLDIDGDQRISLEDFTHGFREFLGFSKRKASEDDITKEEKQKRRLRKQASIQAWRQLTERVGKDAIGRFLANSTDELFGLYAELHETEAPPKLVMQFEHLMESLSVDARQLELEREQFNETLKREREQHRAHLKSLEEEIEAQVQRVAQVVRQDAETKFEMEKREIQTRLEAEIMQLQSHLRLFQKVENWLQKEQHPHDQLEAAQKASEENRQLKLALTEAQTTLTLLQTELAHLKSEYVAKDRFINSEKETLIDLESHQEHTTRQLELLQDANRQLQDTNDSLRACMADIARRSPIGSNGTPRERSSFMGHFHDAEAGLRHSSASSIRQELDAISRSSLDSLHLGYEANGPPDRTFKVVFAGDASVGKTSFIRRACDGLFLAQTVTTLGVDFRVKSLRVDERNVAVQLWDTAGQERFRSITRSYFRTADGVLLAFDVTNERSFVNVRSWCDSVNEALDRSRASASIPVLLCGTKSDLRDRDGIICVQPVEAERLASQVGAVYIETSAKTGQNVIEALVLLTRQMMTRQDCEVRALKLTDSKSVQRKCCSS